MSADPVSTRSTAGDRSLVANIVLELVFFSILFAILFAAMVSVEAFELAYEMSRDYEDWELDEIILAFCAIGITGFAFVARRWFVERRDKREIALLSEDLMEALEQAKAADKAKSAFLAGLSHELRTPIVAINGYAHFIESGAMGPVDPRYSNHARSIRESGEHLLAIVNDILDVTRILAGKVELYPQDTDLHALTEECFKFVQGPAQDGEIRLNNAVPAGFPTLSVDGQRFKQVLINLVANAVKFSPSGGEVSVSARAEAGAAVIEVRDQGVGMDPGDAERAMEPFTQLDNELSRSHEGTGLGLAIVKHFVDLHGGSVALDTAPGKGLTAIIILPPSAFAGAARAAA
ncbi:HAMP domain-containing sensor histidine kinase [Pelagibius sp.]|uniref:sensor histidine kinase n=1 Tax=Pelagibius sp. TaxID=1931238 RepID=UPI00260EC6E9|nr:HAMP domain-containing sensor histidine kinase [Pelagibius sp.]